MEAAEAIMFTFAIGSSVIDIPPFNNDIPADPSPAESIGIAAIIEDAASLRLFFAFFGAVAFALFVESGFVKKNEISFIFTPTES